MTINSNTMRMIKLLSTIVVLLFSNFNFAQSTWQSMDLKGKVKELKVEKKKPSYSGWWDIETHVVQFNPSGSEILFEWKDTKTTYTYDENKRLVQKKYEGKSWMKTVTVETYSYDGNGRLVKEELNQVSANRKSAIFYEYDNNGNLIKKVDEYNDNEVVHYTYDKKNQLIKEVSSKRNHGIIYEYDSRGNRIKKSGLGAGYIVYKYNSNNQLVEELWYEENKKLDSRFTYKYNNAGRITEKSFYGMFLGGERLTSQEFCEYDDHQNLTKEEKYLGDHGQRLKYMHYTYSYDNHGNWTVKKSFDNERPKNPAVTETRTITYYE